MKRAAVITSVLAVMLCGAGPAHAWNLPYLRHQSTDHIIAIVFGSSGWCANRIADRESRDKPWARNGQYVGIFQLGYGWYAGGYGNAWRPWPYLIRRPFPPTWRIRNILAAHYIVRRSGSFGAWGGC